MSSETTVLIVEDDRDSQYVYERFLSYHGYTVLLAGTGEEGIRMATENDPDIVLMDISIPGMDGWEVTRRLKADPTTAEIPIIVITAHAFPEDRERSRQVGCEGFLTKPCEPRQILEEIQKLAAKP